MSREELGVVPSYFLFSQLKVRMRIDVCMSLYDEEEVPTY